MRQLIRATSAILLVLLAGLTTGIVTSAAPPPPADTGRLEFIAGRGEKMLLVVAGSYASEDDALTAAANLSFGDVQGFYVDSSDNYELLGVYDQPTPNYKSVKCADLGPPEKCPEGVSQVLAHQVVTLSYVPRASLRAFSVARGRVPCARVDLPPCMEGKFSTIFDSSWSGLEAGRTLLLAAFRTKQGAESFASHAVIAGAEDAVVLRVRKLGGGYVGLGQEAHPDGVSGPLLKPFSDPDLYQE